MKNTGFGMANRLRMGGLPGRPNYPDEFWSITYDTKGNAGHVSCNPAYSKTTYGPPLQPNPCRRQPLPLNRR